MSNSDAEDRTEDATEKRKKEAREQGQVIRSKDWNTLVILFSASISIVSFNERFIKTATNLLQKAFTYTHEDLFKDDYITHRLSELTLDALYGIFPLFIVLILAALIGGSMIGGVNFSIQNC